jgi:hypothetical protein
MHGIAALNPGDPEPVNLTIKTPVRDFHFCR